MPGSDESRRRSIRPEVVRLQLEWAAWTRPRVAQVAQCELSFTR